MGLVTLVDVERDPLRFRFRLVASPVTRHLGYELTGRYLDEVPERDMRSYLDSAYRRLATERVCLHESGERILDRRIWRHESLLLPCCAADGARSEEHTSELQSLMRTSYAVFCLKKKK